MSLVEKIAIYIGKNTKHILNFDDDTEEIVIYGAINLIQTSLSFLLTTLIGFILGVFYESLVITSIISVLKKYSGGAHASSPRRCLFIGSLISISFSLLISNVLCEQYIYTIYTISTIGILSVAASLCIIIKKAPVDTKNKTITSIKMRKRLKYNSIVIILICSIAMGVMLILFDISSNILYIKTFQCIGFGLLWQSFTLTNFAIGFLGKIDSLLPF